MPHFGEPRPWPYMPVYTVYYEDGAWRARPDDPRRGRYHDVNALTVLQWALDHLTAGRTTKEIVVVKGALTVPDAIDVPSYTILDLRQAKITLADGVNKNIIEIYGKTQIDIIGGELDGNGDNQAIAAPVYLFCITVENSTFVTIQEVYVHDGYNFGISIAKGSADCKILRCWAGDNGKRADGDDGIEVTHYDYSGDGAASSPCERVIVAENHCWGSKENGIEIEVSYECTVIDNICWENGNRGVEVDGMVATDCRSITVEDNICEENIEQGISIEYINGAIISDNILRYNLKHGIYVRECHNIILNKNICKDSQSLTDGNGISIANSDGINVEGGSCANNGYDGIQLTGTTDHVKIIGVQLRDNTQRGLYATGAHTYLSISDCDVWDNGADGIYLAAGVSNSQITDNIIEGNAGAYAIVDAGTNNRIIDNFGFNPQAASTPAVGASPVTFGPYNYPACIEVVGDVTSVTIRGQASGFPAAVNFAGCWPLYPGDTIVIVYPGAAPTVTLWPQ